MIKKIVDYMLEKQIAEGLITREDTSVYQYGYTLVFEVIVNLIVAIILGILMHKLFVICFFLFIFIPFRSFCGGYHANSAWKCTLLSNIILFFASTLYLKFNMTFLMERKMIWIFFEIVCISIINCLAPVQSSNRKLSFDERKKYKRIIKIILIIHIVIELFLATMHIWQGVVIIFETHVIQLLSLVMGKLCGGD